MGFLNTGYLAIGLVGFLCLVLAISMAARAEAIYFIRFVFGKEDDKVKFWKSLSKIIKVAIFSIFSIVIIVIVHEWSHFEPK